MSENHTSSIPSWRQIPRARDAAGFPTAKNRYPSPNATRAARTESPELVATTTFYPPKRSALSRACSMIRALTILHLPPRIL